MEEKVYDPQPDVLMFIGRFSTDGWLPRLEVQDCFLFGCCYWFAFILSVRFAEHKPEIVIDYVANHFGCRINGVVYDIRGDVTAMYNWEPWADCKDSALKERIDMCCINF